MRKKVLKIDSVGYWYRTNKERVCSMFREFAFYLFCLSILSLGQNPTQVRGANIQGVLLLSSERLRVNKSCCDWPRSYVPDSLLKRLQVNGYNYVVASGSVSEYDDLIHNDSVFYPTARHTFPNGQTKVWETYREAFIKAWKYRLLLIPSFTVSTQYGADWSVLSEIAMNHTRAKPCGNGNCGKETWCTPLADDTTKPNWKGFNAYFGELIARVREEYKMARGRHPYDTLSGYLYRDSMPGAPDFLPYILLSYDENWWIDTISGGGYRRYLLPGIHQLRSPSGAPIDSEYICQFKDKAMGMKCLYAYNIYKRAKTAIDSSFPGRTKVMVLAEMFDPEYYGGIPYHLFRDNTNETVKLAANVGRNSDVLDLPDTAGRLLKNSTVNYFPSTARKWIKDNIIMNVWYYNMRSWLDDSTSKSVYNAVTAMKYFTERGFNICSWSAIDVPNDSSAISVDALMRTKLLTRTARTFSNRYLGYFADWYPCNNEATNNCLVPNGIKCRCQDASTEKNLWVVKYWNCKKPRNQQPLEYSIIEYLPTVVSP